MGIHPSKSKSSFAPRVRDQQSTSPHPSLHELSSISILHHRSSLSLHDQRTFYIKNQRSRTTRFSRQLVEFAVRSSSRKSRPVPRSAGSQPDLHAVRLPVPPG